MAMLSKSFVILIFRRWITNYEARNPFLSPFHDTFLVGEKKFFPTINDKWNHLTIEDVIRSIRETESNHWT